ncbi:neprilysin-2-like [Planococcus citri]|uniref:neprilysin-2-like n=1 Tax=Planococcus citri TaxID=170843 RepID=UPI0031F7A8E0
MRTQLLTSFLRVFSLKITLFSLLSLFSLVLVSAQNTTNEKICQTEECLSAARKLKESMNFEADPCDNFYKYACGNWPNLHKDVNHITRSNIQLLAEENIAKLIVFLKQNSSNEEPEAVHKARQFYSLCLNEDAYSKNLDPIITILKKIGLPVLPSPSDKNKNFDYTTTLAKAAKLAGIKMYFDLTTDSNPYNRSSNIITLKKTTLISDLDSSTFIATKPLHEKYLNEVIRRICEDDVNSCACVCAQWKSSRNENESMKNTIHKILMGNSYIEIPWIDVRSYGYLLNSSNDTPVIYSLKQLQELTDRIAFEANATNPKLNWTRYIEETYKNLDMETLDLSDSSKVQIAIENLVSFVKICKYIHSNVGSRSVKSLELELWWKVVSTLSPYIDKKIFDTRNKIDIVSNTEFKTASDWKMKLDNLVDYPARERQCAEITESSFGMAVSFAYGTKAKYVRAEIEIGKMFDHIRESIKQIVQKVPWMDETTRQRALKKLQSVKYYFAYPNVNQDTIKLDDFYRNAKISNNFYDTVISNIQNQVEKTLSKLNQINNINEDDWRIISNIENVFYEPRMNTIVIPASKLGSSKYENNLRFLDYGAIGSAIGRELTRAIDHSGRHYNEIGNIDGWWLPETLHSYEEKAKCFGKAGDNRGGHGIQLDYSDFKLKADSQMTLGEDKSDSSGFKESLSAYRKSVSQFGEESLLPQFENFTHEQLFTLSFANVWCETPIYVFQEYFRFVDDSPITRVNQILQNSTEFAEIWKCPKGSNMNPASDKCSIW